MKLETLKLITNNALEFEEIVYTRAEEYLEQTHKSFTINYINYEKENMLICYCINNTIYESQMPYTYLWENDNIE